MADYVWNDNNQTSDKPRTGKNKLMHIQFELLWRLKRGFGGGFGFSTPGFLVFRADDKLTENNRINQVSKHSNTAMHGCWWPSGSLTKTLWGFSDDVHVCVCVWGGGGQRER